MARIPIASFRSTPFIGCAQETTEEHNTKRQLRLPNRRSASARDSSSALSGGGRSHPQARLLLGRLVVRQLVRHHVAGLLQQLRSGKEKRNEKEANENRRQPAHGSA